MRWRKIRRGDTEPHKREAVKRGSRPGVSMGKKRAKVPDQKIAGLIKGERTEREL